jgi:hypothetical protein
VKRRIRSSLSRNSVAIEVLSSRFARSVLARTRVSFLVLSSALIVCNSSLSDCSSSGISSRQCSGLSGDSARAGSVLGSRVLLSRSPRGRISMNDLVVRIGPFGAMVRQGVRFAPDSPAESHGCDGLRLHLGSAKPIEVWWKKANNKGIV